MVLAKGDIRKWLAAGLLFLLTNPMWVWNIHLYVRAFIGFLFFLITLPNIKLSKISIWASFAFSLQLIFLVVMTTTENTNLNGYIYLFIISLGFATIYFCKDNYWKSIIDKYIIILAILLIPALIEHVLMLFLNISSHYHYITECPANPGRNYYIYNFNAYLVQYFSFNSLRFFSFYDEPGVLGNILMVLLMIQKYNLKKWYNIVFLTAGLLTFSLAFYFSVLGYFIVSSNLKNRLYLIIGAVVLVVLFYNNSLVDVFLVSRMAFEDGQLAGYNRESFDFDVWFSRLSIDDYLFWGYNGNVEYAASWKWALAKWGIVPCFLYFLCIICNAIRSRLRLSDIALCAVIFVIVFIQRPFLTYFLYPVLIFIPHLYLSAVRDIEKKKEGRQTTIQPI